MGNKKYKVIEVPPTGKRKWYGGARTMMFVYSKYHGNFILKGYHKEVEEYLKNHYTHYFYYFSMWSNGGSRGYWSFWKDNVTIFEPAKHRKDWKYKITSSEPRRSYYETSKAKITLHFKRLPKRWIPEFDKL